MADSTAPIAAVNPELGRLINRAKTVMEMIGGASDGTSLRSSRKPRGYDEKRNTILIDITNLEAMLDLLEQGSRPREDEIRLRQQVRRGIMDLNGNIEELIATSKRDLTKRKAAPTPEEMEDRKEDIKIIHDRRAAVKARLAGRRPDAESAGAVGTTGIEMSGFTSGAAGGGGSGAFAASAGGRGSAGGGGGVEYEEEDITDDQRQALEEIRRMDREIDRKLEEDMMAVLDDIDHANRGLGEALDESIVRADDLARHTEKTKEKIERVTRNINRVLDVSDSKSSRCCSYLICVIVLLGIITVIFNVVTSRSSTS